MPILDIGTGCTLLEQCMDAYRDVGVRAKQEARAEQLPMDAEFKRTGKYVTYITK